MTAVHTAREPDIRQSLHEAYNPRCLVAHVDTRYSISSSVTGLGATSTPTPASLPPYPHWCHPLPRATIYGVSAVVIPTMDKGTRSKRQKRVRKGSMKSHRIDSWVFLTSFSSIIAALHPGLPSHPCWIPLATFGLCKYSVTASAMSVRGERLHLFRALGKEMLKCMVSDNSLVPSFLKSLIYLILTFF